MNDATQIDSVTLWALPTEQRSLVDHALTTGAEHLLFGGDIVDHANLDDAKPEARRRAGASSAPQEARLRRHPLTRPADSPHLSQGSRCRVAN